MSDAARGGRSKKAPTRAAKKTPVRSAKKAAAKNAPRAAAKNAPRAAAKNAVSERATTRSPSSASSTSGAVFEKIRALCLALPDTKLTMTWGNPHFRVGEKIFCGFSVEKGTAVMGVKLELDHARSRVKDARFWPSPYVGKHGWVSMNLGLRKAWGEVAALIRESYGLIAPQASLKKLR